MTTTDFTKPQIKKNLVNHAPPNTNIPPENLEREIITKDTTITKAMEINPFAFEIFMDVGLGCSGCFLAEIETIEQGLLTHGFNSEMIQMVVDELNM